MRLESSVEWSGNQRNGWAWGGDKSGFAPNAADQVRKESAIRIKMPLN